MPTNLFALPVYGANSNDFNVTAVPVTMLFNAAQVYAKSIPPTVYAGVTCNSAVYLLPTAPSPIQQVFYTDRTTTQIAALANA